MRDSSLTENCKKNCIFVLCLVFTIFYITVTSLHNSHAAEVTLAWNANYESDIKGYKIYYGLESENYSHIIDVGNWTSCTISDLEEEETYFFAATAYTTSEYESDYSNEISYTPTWDNEPPVADAGPDQVVNEGATVILDGSHSSDEDGIASYQWNQVSGTPVNIVNPSSATPSFTAPNVDSEGASITFQLTVTDTGSLQSTDTCIVSITWDNEPPAADAGPDQPVDEGSSSGEVNDPPAADAGTDQVADDASSSGEVNEPPAADAGTDQPVDNGSSSSDGNGIASNQEEIGTSFEDTASGTEKEDTLPSDTESEQQTGFSVGGKTGSSGCFISTTGYNSSNVSLFHLLSRYLTFLSSDASLHKQRSIQTEK